MIDQKTKEIVNDIVRGKIDINNQSSFFPIVIKGLLLNLNKQIKIRDKMVPHYIVHTGDDTMYLSVKGQDASIEPLEISNEDFVYAPVPRCVVTAKGVNIESDQLTSPYTHGQLQYENNDSLYTLVGEFRRMPLKLTVECKYYVDSWGDVMGLLQQVISKLSFVRTYNVTYMGQVITCSYTMPTSLDEEYLTELDGTTSDSKLRTMDLSLEIETNFPIWDPKTIIYNNSRVTKLAFSSTTDPYYPNSQDPDTMTKNRLGKLIVHGKSHINEGGEIVRSGIDDTGKEDGE